jgi:rare lipoprotein A
VKVTNLANGRSVVVRINDRGPFVRGRTLDLAHGAARQIGMLGSGTARVRIVRLDASGGHDPIGASARPRSTRRYATRPRPAHHKISRRWHRRRVAPAVLAGGASDATAPAPVR